MFAGEEAQLLGSRGVFQPAKWDLTIKGVKSFQSGSVVARRPTEIPAEVTGVSEGDLVWFTKEADCSVHASAQVVPSSEYITVTMEESTDALYKLCYHFAGNQPFLYESYTLSVKELVSMTSSSGNATIAIWLRPKTLLFSGRGVAAGDKVKFVPSGAECSAEVSYMMNPDATSESVAFYTLDEDLSVRTFFSQESSEEAPYQLCYQFAGQEWMNYGPEGVYGPESEFYMIVFGRPEVTASSGAKDVFVKGVSKTLTYSGVLISSRDRIKVVEGSSCEAPAVAAGFDNMMLGASRSLTFTFSDDVYLTKTLTMCFKFAEDSSYVTLFPIAVKALTGATFTSGHAQVLVARQAKTVNLQGYGVSEDDQVKFTYTSCDAAAFEFPVVSSALGFQTTVTIDEPTTSGSLKLCYVFGTEQPVEYAFLTFVVKGLTGASVVSHEDHPVTVFLQSEPMYVVFNGSGISPDDDVYFVPSGMECSAVNAMHPQKMTETHQVYYGFTEAEAEQLYDFCYVFNEQTVSEAPMKYAEYAFTVRSIPTVSTVIPLLSVNGAVVGQEKHFVVESAMAGEGDVVMLVMGANCDGEVLYEIPVEADKSFNMTLLESEESMKLCYMFSGLERRFLISEFEAKEVTEFTPLSGRVKVTANVPYSYRITAVGASAADKAKMVTGEDCDAGQWLDVVDGVAVFSLDNAPLPYKLCYQFANEQPMMYDNMTVLVMFANEIVVDDGLRNDAILFREDNEIAITGMVFPGDRIYPLSNPLDLPASSFTSESCLDGIELSDYLEKDANGKFHVSVSTGGSVLICYLFEGETTPFPTQFNLRVLGVTVAESSVDSMVLGDSVSLWTVKNVTTELRLLSTDTVKESRYKWVSATATDCESAEAMGMADADEGVEMTFDASSGFMVSEFAFSETSEGRWNLCYQFSGKRWTFMSLQSQGDVFQPITMESRALSSIFDVEGSGNVMQLIPRVPKTWAVEVANPTSNDKMRLVSGLSCTERTQIVAEEPVNGYMVSWNVATELPQLNVCFGFDNGASTLWVLYKEYVVDVLFVNAVSASGNKNLLYVGMPKQYTFAGSFVDRIDSVYLVPETAPCDNATAVAQAAVTEASATLAVLEPVEATLKMCVHFAEEGDVSVTPTNEAILRVHVVAVTALESLEGHSAGAAVVSQAKRFRLMGSHPELVSEVIFTKSTCAEPFKTFAVSEGAFTGLFEEHTEGAELSLCVKYENEEPVETGIQMSLKALLSVSVNKGDHRVLVWGTSKTFTFHGYGVSDRDTAEFVLATSVPKDDE